MDTVLYGVYNASISIPSKKNASENVMTVEYFNFKELRKDYFSKYYPYDDELAEIVNIKQASELKKHEESHEFLKKPLWQNMYIYLVEYLLAFSQKWFGSNNFTILDWGCGKCQVSYLLKKRNAAIISIC